MEEKNKQLEIFNESGKKKRRQGSHFPDEVYFFDDDKNNIEEFVRMLKNRGYYIGEDNHIRTNKGNMASKLMRNGYFMTSAQYNKKFYYFMEHRVIYTWIKGPIPDGLVINHKDYNKTNNSIDNLEAITQKENSEYSRCHFNPCRGEKSPKSILTNEEAEAIKTVCNLYGFSKIKIAELFNINRVNVYRICSGSRYPNVVEQQDIMKVYPILVDYTRNKEIGEIEELKNYALGLCGETGEFIDLIKKYLYHGKELDKNAILFELGDILYYLTAICLVLGIDIYEIMINNNYKLLNRYKNGFSIEDSINRIEDKINSIQDSLKD